MIFAERDWLARKQGSGAFLALQASYARIGPSIHRVHPRALQAKETLGSAGSRSSGLEAVLSAVGYVEFHVSFREGFRKSIHVE